MSAIISTSWSPSVSLYSNWLLTVVVISALVCFIATLRPVRGSSSVQLLLVVGAPICFSAVLFAELGMFVVKDGREFGFPVWGRAYPNAADFLATYVALGAGYLVARQATRTPLPAVRIIAWTEVAVFASLGALELLLLIRRVLVA